MEYLRNYEMETLFIHYKDLAGAIQSIRRELVELSKGVDLDDDIASLALNRAAFNDVVSHIPGYVPDKTGNIALRYQETLDEQQKALYREVTEELLLLEFIRDKLNIALQSLTSLEKGILENKYWNKMDWFNIECKFSISKTTGCSIRKEGIAKMIRVSRITVLQYQQVMRILNLQ